MLPDPNVNPQVKNEYENFSSVLNLGKVTLVGFAEQQTEVVATKIDTEPSLQFTGPVKCLQIPTNFTLNVLAAEGLLKNDNEYFDMVRQLNETFLDKYDVSALDGIEKCHYLDQPSGNAGGILQTVLAPKVHGHNHSKFDDCCDIERHCPVQALPCTGRETVQQGETSEGCRQARAVEKFKNTAWPYAITPLSIGKNDASTPGHETATVDDYVEMTSPVTADGYCTMTRGSPRHKSESEASVQRVEGMTITEAATLEPARKVLLNIPVPLDLSALEVIQRGKSEKMNETIGLKDAAETSETTLTLTEMCAESLKEDAEIVKPESTIEKSSDSVSKDQCGIPADLASLSVEGVERLLRSLNMARYINTFRNEQIDGEILMELHEGELMSLEVLPFHVMKLMKVISGWRPTVQS